MILNLLDPSSEEPAGGENLIEFSCCSLAGELHEIHLQWLIAFMNNALTFDLEDYFHVTAFADQVKPESWRSRESRLQANTDRILEMLGSSRQKATFFVLGWVAAQYRTLVSKIAAEGHEIACHSNLHRVVYQMSPEEFREDTRRAKELLEDASQKPVLGYRAPSFSIPRDCRWAFDTLSELGFVYDSSIFPVRHPNYGTPEAQRFPHLMETPSGPLVEFPLPTLELAGRRSPFGGGAYLRLLPYWYTRWAISFVNQHENQGVCVYAHPWELDPEQPRMTGTVTSRIRHYLGLRGTEGKLRNLLADFQFATLHSIAVTILHGASLTNPHRFEKSFCSV